MKSNPDGLGVEPLVAVHVPMSKTIPHDKILFFSLCKRVGGGQFLLKYHDGCCSFQNEHQSTPTVSEI